MANTKNTSKTEFKGFDQYVSEVESDAVPFELPVDKDTTLYFDPPTGARIEHFSRAWREGDTNLALWALAGDSWPELEKLTANKHFKVVRNIMEDMARHFKLIPEAEEVELRGPGGGTVKESDPQRIQQLQGLGFTIVGESQPR